ncbi:MAG: HEAT repeat domain-containing protein [Planctomycetota bacterium]|nr:HEAT repeat domain-containing protein [Planctomycetota bacterium]
MQTVADHRALVEALAKNETWADAVRALDAAGPGALDAVVEGLSHADERVRKHCAALLDHHADARCAEPLVKALRDPDAGVRRLAVHSVGCQRCKRDALPLDVVGLLIERMRDDASLRVRQVAAHMLGNQALEHPADPRAVAALKEMLATEQNAKLRSNAAWALSVHQRQEPN